jgi:hypothetical protein
VPHVVLNGTAEMVDLFQQLSPIVISYEKTLLKTSDKYINFNKNSILVESLAIEDGNKIGFLVLIGKREDGLVFRIYPEFAIEKTIGVKRILAGIAKQLLERFSELKIGRTNLQEFL